MTYRIGILGSGNVGGTLGVRWAQAGHSVVFGSRQPETVQMRELVAQGRGHARGGTNEAAVRDADVLLLATPWEAVQGLFASLPALGGKIVIDAVNPLLPGLTGLAVGTDTSAAEQVAGWAPGARVVKAFNTIGFNIMANPKFPGAPATAFYCGDDAEAKQVVHQLAADLGFDPLDAGPLRQARVLEPLAMLWISLALQFGQGREIAFHLLRR